MSHNPLLNRKATEEWIKSHCSINPVTGCWIWGMQKDRFGYGIAKENGRSIAVHRRMFEIRNGIIPQGQCVLHNCPGGDNPNCCNPDHLWVGTRGDNNRDSVSKGRQRIVNRKLTQDQIRDIRADPRTQCEIAETYEVHQNTISRIKRRELYCEVL